MATKKNSALSEKMSQVVVRGMQEKKALDIVVMDLRNIKNAIADFFVLSDALGLWAADAISTKAANTTRFSTAFECAAFMRSAQADIGFGSSG